MSKAPQTIIVAGAGGVGKTTLSAGLGAVAAINGRRVLVVTVDPARRLADALGIPGIGNHPTEVASIPTLSVAMLDVTASWEAITRRHADPEVADRLAMNPFFRAIADRFPAAQSYAAAEQMAEFIEAGFWDVIVVDTPPAAGGLDFFLAPRRMRELVGGRILRWLTGARIPARRAVYRATARPVLRVADSVLGGPLLADIADFLLDLRTLYDGLSARARSIDRTFKASAVLVVTTPHPTPMREARRFYDELGDAAIIPRGILFNRVLPDEWITRAAGRPPRGHHAREQHDLLNQWAEEAKRMSDARRDFAARYRTVMATVPWRQSSPTTLDELIDLVRSIEGLDLETLTRQR